MSDLHVGDTAEFWYNLSYIGTETDAVEYNSARKIALKYGNEYFGFFLFLLLYISILMPIYQLALTQHFSQHFVTYGMLVVNTLMQYMSHFILNFYLGGW